MVNSQPRKFWFQIPLLVLALVLVGGWQVAAEAPPDPYADAVATGSGLLINDPAAAVGAPDGATAVVVGVEGEDLILDMGSMEEGTGDLTVYYGGLSVALLGQVEFLDAGRNVIHSAALPMSGLVPGTIYTATVVYPQKPQPYHYVRLASLLQAYSIDAVEARTFRPDSDGDGLPDDWEMPNDLDPLDPDGDNGPDGNPDGDGCTNSQEYQRGTNPHVPDCEARILFPVIAR